MPGPACPTFHQLQVLLSCPPTHCCPAPCCRPPLPVAFTRQRRGWATRHLVVEREPGAESMLPPGGGSAGASPHATPGGSLSASQAARVWTQGGTPRSWLWNGTHAGVARGARGGGAARTPRRQSTCQLELDASVDAILNRQQVGQGQAGRRNRLRPCCCQGRLWSLHHEPRVVCRRLIAVHGVHPPCSWCASRWRQRASRSAW